MANNIQLSKNFKLSELVKSSTADRHGIDNWPTDPDIIENLRDITEHILQPVRDHYGVAFAPNSGYRCLELNRLLKSSDKSKHRFGQAVDIEISGIPNKDLAEWIRDNLDYDKILLEFWYDNDPMSGWVHIQYVSPEENRGTCFTINKNGVFTGFRSS